MPLYYNTTAPSNGPSNTITTTATDLGLRDFLLNLNIQNPIRYPQLSTSINGAPRGGEPFLDTMVGSGVIQPQVSLDIDGLLRYAVAILPNHYKDDDPTAPRLTNIITTLTSPIFPTSPNGTANYLNVDINEYGILPKSNYREFRKQATLKNLYLDATKQVDTADLISLQPILTAQQQPSYDQAWGQLNNGGSVSTQVVDAIGSVLNGQGVGIANGGLVTNFDIRASLAGRVLGATGVLNDTKLGIIGGQQLALSLANNAAFNTEQAILGSLNLQQNVLAIFGNGGAEFPRPNYKITVSDDTLGQILGVAERVLGFTLPKSNLDDSGSVFSTENQFTGNIERSNQMLSNTGKGQRKALSVQFEANTIGISKNRKDDNPSESPFRSGYSPDYKRGTNGDSIVGTPKIYAFFKAGAANNSGFVQNFLKPSNNGVIPDLSWNREKLVEDSGFTFPKSTFKVTIPTAGGLVPIEGELTDTYGNGVSHIKTPTFSWTSSNDGGPTKPTNTVPTVIGGAGDKKSLLGKTQKLFNDKGMINLVSVKGDMSNPIPSQIQTSIVNNGMSKGSAVLNGSLFDNNTGQISRASLEANNTFCRAWTTFDRYDKVYKLIRNRGLNQSEQNGSAIIPESKKSWRINTKGSVLDDNGFVKIAPYKTDDLKRSATEPKKYMFSIENLAWVGSPAANLLPVEQGPGDLLTGKFGRIMWFPPYDLTFSESSSVSLETTSFIGRGEPIYTYNNTERTGNLSFKIIIDHPSIMNAFKGDNGPSDEFIRSWYAGCVDLGDKWASLLTKEEIATQETRKVTKVDKKIIPPATPPDPIKIYFPNDVTKIESLTYGASETENPPNGMNGGYENGKTDVSVGIGNYNGEPQQKKAGGPFVNSPSAVPAYRTDGLVMWPDTTEIGLNGPNNKLVINGKDYTNPDGWKDPLFIADLKAYLNPPDGLNSKVGCPACKAVCTGYASSQGTSYANEQLLKNRAESMQKWLLDNGILTQDRITVDTTASKVKSGNYDSTTPVDQKAVKEDRYAAIVFVNNAEAIEEITTTEVVEDIQISLNQQVKNRFYNEADFFEKLKQTDPVVFDSIKQKIRYFDPAFHSMTPEGFNSRLTFLLQCTRQGPTISDVGPQNLAFGPQPVCILRIGDFYNTKIMIDNMTFDFEPLVWDLNPEGVGVQPMIANVTMSFKYIGGSSLYSPINKLQNALSFNYFANTQAYDPRADQVVKDNKDRPGGTFGDKNKDANPEPNYILMPGIDSTKTSLGALNPYEVTNAEATDTTKNNNQTATNAASTSTADAQGQTDLAKLKLEAWSGNTYQTGSILTFYISRKDNTDNTSLGRNYLLLGSIKDKTGVVYEDSIQATVELNGATLGQQEFNWSLDDTTPSYVPLDFVNNTYTLEVEVVGAGTLSANIISGQTSTTSTSQAAGDVTTDTANISKDLRIKETNITTANGRIDFVINKIDAKKLYSQKYLVKVEINNLTDAAENLALGVSNTSYQYSFGENYLLEEGSSSYGYHVDFDKTTPVCPGLKITATSKYSLKVTLVGQTNNTDNIVISSSIGGNQSSSNANADDINITDSLIANTCDDAHNFSDMIGRINDAQMELYNKGINPKVTKLIVSITKAGNIYTQNFDVTVGKSPDGKAWTGFETRGSCGKQKCQATDIYYDYIERADGQYNGTSNACIVAASSPCYNKSLEQCMKDNVNAVDWDLVQTYQDDTLQFKQYFAQFTKSTYPAK